MYKKIDGRQYSFLANNIKEALRWRNTFNPNVSLSVKEKDERVREQIMNEQNGVDKGYFFEDVLNKYKLLHIPTLEKSTIETKLATLKIFYDLEGVRMMNLTPDFFDKYIIKKKNEAIVKLPFRSRTTA